MVPTQLGLCIFRPLRGPLDIKGISLLIVHVTPSPPLFSEANFLSEGHLFWVNLLPTFDSSPTILSELSPILSPLSLSLSLSLWKWVFYLSDVYFVFDVIVYTIQKMLKKIRMLWLLYSSKKGWIYTASICLKVLLQKLLFIMMHVSWSTEKILDLSLNDCLIVNSTAH